MLESWVRNARRKKQKVSGKSQKLEQEGRKAKGTKPGNKKRETRSKKTGNTRSRKHDTLSKTRKAAAKARSQHTRSKSKKQAKKLGRVRVRKSVARGHGGRPRSQHKTKAWSVLQSHGVSVWPRFWRLEGCILELVSCRFRMQH